MKNKKCYIVFMLIGLFFFGSFSNVLAEDRFNIDDQSITAIVDKSMKDNTAISADGYTEIAWKIKLRNDTDKPVSTDVTVAFLNSEKDKLGVATKTSKFEPGESKIVSSTVLLRSALAQKIASGYVAVAEAENALDAEAHSVSATIDDSLKAGLAENSDQYIKIAYTVKLRNKTNKPMTPDITIAFLNGDNDQLGKEAMKTSLFKAGEVKTISDTIVLRASEVKQIAAGQVSIVK